MVAQEPPKPPKRPPGGQGPYNDQIVPAVSKNGRDWWVSGKGAIAQHASVPDVVEDGKGRLLVYFVDFGSKPGPGQEGLSVMTSDDGEAWSKAQPVKLAKKPNKGAPVDPSVVRLDDGRFRLYFFGSEMTGGDPAKAEGPHRVYSAVSKDGVDFECEDGVRFEMEQITDPEVIQADGAWWMFLSKGRESLVAKSADGLKFEKVDVTFKGGVPGALAVEGGVRVFTCEMGIISYFWDLKSAPKEEGSAIKPLGGPSVVADPAALRRADGSYFMIFKVGQGGPPPKTPDR